MARDAVTVTSKVLAGVSPTLDTPNATNNARMPNANGKTIFVFVNGMGAASTQATDVTIQQVADPYGRIQNEAAHTVAVNTVAVFGPFPPALYNNSDGEVDIDYDAVDGNARVFGMNVF